MVADYQRCGRDSDDAAEARDDEDRTCERRGEETPQRHELGAAHAGPGQGGLVVADTKQPHAGTGKCVADRGQTNDQRLRVERQ